MSYSMVGVDPEMFLVGKNGRAVPAHTLFPEKSKREQVGRCSSYYRDGYAVEFNITYGQTCRETLITYLYEAISAAAYTANKRGLRLISVPAVRVNLSELVEAPTDVQVFGCKPSVNAYTKLSSIPDIEAMAHPFRYAGGHLHFSFPLAFRSNELLDKHHCWILDPENVFLFVKMMDLFVGVPMTYIEANPLNFLRRENYGKAGEFRFQHYSSTNHYNLGAVGIEYRTLSPFWLRQPGLLSFALGMGREIFNNFHSYAKKWDSSLEPKIRKAIDTGIGLRGLLQDIPPIQDTANACIPRLIPKAFLTRLASQRIRERNYLEGVQGGSIGWYRWISTFKGGVV